MTVTAPGVQDVRVPKTLSYADAVKLLGRKESKLVDALDKLAGGALLGGALLAPGLLGLLGAKGEFVRLCHKLVIAASDKHSGRSRYNRTQRLEAAHAVLVVAAFFEAFDEADLPFQVRDLQLSEDDSQALAGRLLDTPVPVPQAHLSYEDNLDEVGNFFRWVELAHFLSGLAIFDQLDETRQERVRARLETEVPATAVRRYEELLRQLAGEFPEIRFWHAVADGQATRAEIRGVGVALAEVERTLAGIVSGRDPDARRAELAKKYRAALERPIIDPDDVPDGLRIPLLGNGYIDPCYRVAAVDSGAAPSQRSWWDGIAVRQDMYAFLVGYLTSSQATSAPLLVLGDPGSGKSVLTKVLAARLPASDFMTVRVELRSAPAEADLLQQIEHGLRDAVKEELSWAELARSADDALPVILLDGFDELLQATGVSQTNYLVKIAEFQRDRAEVDRPVAVVVTSRITVADRARIPSGTVAVRLEPFDDRQIEAWLRTWNTGNAEHFVDNGQKPLGLEAVQPYPDLAGQPLLLLMLALYDADGNALQRSKDTIGRGELYERLLTRFARREVAKDERDEISAADVEHELRRLSVVAFAMFNRGSQWVTEPDLDRDLSALLGVRRSPAQGLRTPLGAGESVLGRFFFVQRSQAVRDNNTLCTYEFLHATFGEFLVARFTWHVLRDMVTVQASRAGTLLSGGLDDSLLYALLSFSALVERAPVIDFLCELVRGAEHADLVKTLLRGALDPHPERTHTGYEPVRLSVPARCAAYSANLITLAVVAQGTLKASELFEGDPVGPWHSLALFWQSQLSNVEWEALIDNIMLERIWDGDRRDVLLRLETGFVHVPPGSGAWILDFPPSELRSEEYTGQGRSSLKFQAVELRRETNFVCGTGGDVLSHTIDPFADWLDDAVGSFCSEHQSDMFSNAHVLLSLLLGNKDVSESSWRPDMYRRALSALRRDRVNFSYCKLIMERAVADPAVDARLLAELATGVHVTYPGSELVALLCSRLGHADDDDVLPELILAWGGFEVGGENGLDAVLRMSERGRFPELVELLKQFDLTSIAQTRPDLITRARRELRERGREDDIVWPTC